MEEDASLSCGISASSFLLYICLGSQPEIKKYFFLEIPQKSRAKVVI
jgi:hypothetical protein